MNYVYCVVSFVQELDNYNYEDEYIFSTFDYAKRWVLTMLKEECIEEKDIKTYVGNNLYATEITHFGYIPQGKNDIKKRYAILKKKVHF